MVFTPRSGSKKLKILFDLGGFGDRNWHCLGFCITWHKSVLSGGTFSTDFCQICHMELLGSDYRGFPGC